ncbi:Uncharacterised protein [Peptostreptococcus anaerobius]|uniref:Uncharacterized protein n=1 Tax=Peptostreptococcus anaerobius TaxID=1261 RepID=A0A379CIQ3_9FIRM|nr:hypothetical protein [Peptostreptococcus anaerobius]SFN18156.1 hypothetical protein SAMN05660467_01519 [Peptostreptococcus anaerobius]SUB62108.1 Uncharacterised protein [Peptostreptococcus anaerobius]
MELPYKLQVIAVEYAIEYIESEMYTINRYGFASANSSEDYKNALQGRLNSLKQEYKQLKRWLESEED